MCKSQAEGGQRCASHTKVGYDQKLTSFLNRASSSRDDLQNQSQDLLEAATLYATTKKGIAVVEENISRFSEEEGKAFLVETLNKALVAGKEQRAIMKEVEAQIAAAKRPQEKKTQEEKKTQAKIVREHVGKLYDDINHPIIELNSKLYSFGERKPVTDLDAFHEEIDKQSKAAQEAVAKAYAKFAKATVKELKEHALSPEELKNIEIEDLYRLAREGGGMSKLDYYKARFAIEDKYNPDPEGTKYVYAVTGHYAGDNFRENHSTVLDILSNLEDACKIEQGRWDDVSIARKIVR